MHKRGKISLQSMTRVSKDKTKKLHTSRAWLATPLKFGDVLRNVGARHRMLHSLYVFISLSNALVSTTPEAAAAAKSEGCQPNHFGLGLWLGYGLGRIYVAFCGALFSSYFFSVTQSYGKWTKWIIETRT